jgi:hypothetical protein
VIVHGTTWTFTAHVHASTSRAYEPVYEPEPEYEPVNDYADEHAGDSGAALMKVSPIATPPGVPGAQVLHSRNTRTTDL